MFVFFCFVLINIHIHVQGQTSTPAAATSTQNVGCDGTSLQPSTCGRIVSLNLNSTLLPSIYIAGQEYPAPYRDGMEYTMGTYTNKKSNKQIEISFLNIKNQFIDIYRHNYILSIEI
jgi:hypothetical protein